MLMTRHPPGTGTELAVVASSLGRSMESSFPSQALFSYAPPRVTSIALPAGPLQYGAFIGANRTAAMNVTVQISGQDFGPSGVCFFN